MVHITGFLLMDIWVDLHLFFLLCKLNNSVSLCFYQIIFGNRILKSRFISSKSKCMYISLYYFYYEISNVYG